jgi:hypothetical protein
MQIRFIDETLQPHTLDRQDQVKEALVDETLTISCIGALITALESYDAGADCLIEDQGSAHTFLAASPGLYRLRCVAGSGVRQVLIRVVERSVLSAIPDPGFQVGQGHSTAPRLALRSICNHCPTWDGSADWFWDGRVKLADHGIHIPQI